ncbi:MAG: hypothetical protein RIR48_600 [Bacteroidota bacterium]
MNILVLYDLVEFSSRNTIIEHLKSFERYSNHKVFYFNVAFGVPEWVEDASFELIVYHYTICGLKWSRPETALFSVDIRRLGRIKGYKIAIPQDEYVHNIYACKFFKEQGISSIFTCFFKEDYAKAYPEELTGITHIETVLPGYLDEFALQNWGTKVKNHSERSIDLGYRARKNPYWLGRLGVYKWKVAEVFKQSNDTLIKDISTLPKDVFTGDEWYKFLMRCRCVLGTESGSTLLDFDGSIRKAVNKYQKENPNASFEQCEDSCFKGLDGNINLSTVSPRHFEAMLTRTCQVLVEGKYADILVPDRHYIPIKKDFSNVDEVVNKIKDVKLCETIANTCYEEIVGTAKITYRDFIEQILNSVIQKIEYQPSDEKILLLFAKYELQPWRFNPFKYFMLKVKGFLKAKLVEFGLSKYFIRS